MRSALLKEGASLEGRRFIVVSNRQPFAHVLAAPEADADAGALGDVPFHPPSGADVRLEKPPSGLTLAMEPILQATRGTWIASASSDLDARFVDARGRVTPRPHGVEYNLRRLFIPQPLQEDFYTGFANSALWPLCHIVYHQPQFEERWWRAYQQVNRLFAEAVADEVGGHPAIVFIQDFHFALLSRYLRRMCPEAILAQFWHIPWPNPEAFRICPWRRELLDGLLGNDLLGFHLPYHCNNFLETVDRELPVRIDRERNDVVWQGQRTDVAAFPISVDYSRIREHALKPETQAEAEALRERLGQGRRIVLSIERMDYSKGILERLAAIERFLERQSEWHQRVCFVHVATPSRTTVRAYREYSERVDQRVREINARFRTPNWEPLQAHHVYLQPETVWTWYHAADMVIVSSLHDGMNLVSKEYVAASRDDGLLLLSEFAGASRQLREALPLNPYAPDPFAAAILAGLQMDLEERQQRMRRLRWRVSNHDIGQWARDILRAVRQHEFDASYANPAYHDASNDHAPLAATRPPRTTAAYRQRL